MEEAFSGLEPDRYNVCKVGDIASQPFFLSGEQSFDLVVSTHTFSHLSEQLKPIALRNLLSVTAGGGAPTPRTQQCRLLVAGFGAQRATRAEKADPISRDFISDYGTRIARRVSRFSVGPKS